MVVLVVFHIKQNLCTSAACPHHQTAPLSAIQVVPEKPEVINVGVHFMQLVDFLVEAIDLVKEGGGAFCQGPIHTIRPLFQALKA